MGRTVARREKIPGILPELTDRGAHPEDPRAFSTDTLPRLGSAAQELAWLIDRGYPRAAALAFVGDHHRLNGRQRLALERGVCSANEYRRRAAREEDLEDVAGKTLLVDGLDLLVMTEVALAGGLVLVCADGAVRDLSGPRAHYRPIRETEEAIDRIGVTLASVRVARTVFYLDSPVESAGKLRARLLEHAAGWSCAVDVQIVKNPDASLTGARHVVSTDGSVMEASSSWFNLGARVVDRIKSAWLLRLI
jgi:hypothetical protein